MSGTLVDILQQAAMHHAARCALRARAGTRSYGELWSAAGRIAAQLAAHGIGAGTRVVLWTEKTPSAVEAIVGTLLAGAAVVPVDARAPWRHVQRIVADAAPAALIVDGIRSAHVAEILADSAVRLVLGIDADDPRAGPPWMALGASCTGTAPPAATIKPEDPAYLFYTSGSSGAPKAVVISHRAARAFVDWASVTFAPIPDDRFASHAPLHFDLSVFDLWVAFGAGASVRLFDTTEAMLAAWLVDEVRAAEITVWYSVPSILVAMLERGALAAGSWDALRLLLFAGEVFPPRQLARLQRALPTARLVNLYGPTETNVCTWFEVPDALDEGRPIAIGRPCAHLDTAIFDDAMHEVAAGTVGELCVAGANLLSCYWNDPALTARQLVPDPRPGRDGVLYRTGDRVVVGPDGNLHFRGRLDQLVKRRGQRIELGDIEAALLELVAAEAVAAIAIRDAEHGVRVDAYVACTRETLSPADVEAHLRTRLPGAMLPDRVLVRAALPRTANGKIDRIALALVSVREGDEAPSGSRRDAG